MSPVESVDALVVGCGPSGSATALSINKGQGNLRIVVTDRAVFPRDKACGDGIGPGVVDVANALGIEEIFDDYDEIDGLFFHGPSGLGFSTELPLIRGKSVKSFVIPRQVFDNRLKMEVEKAGISVREGWRFLRLTQEVHSVLSVFEVENREVAIRSRVVIGADGANSRVRRQVGEKSNSDQATAIAIRGYITSRAFATDRRVLLDFNRRFLPAYAWAFPIDHQHVNAGLGLTLAIHKRERARLDVMLRDFVKSLSERGFECSQPLNTRTYTLPHAAHLPQMSHGSVALVGDAASMINPLSGEGIAYGMRAGQLVGESIAKFGCNSDALADFERSFKKRYRKHLRSCVSSARLMQSARWAEMMVKASSRNSKVLTDGVEQLFGEGYATPVAVARLMWSGLVPRPFGSQVFLG